MDEKMARFVSAGNCFRNRRLLSWRLQSGQFLRLVGLHVRAQGADNSAVHGETAAWRGRTRRAGNVVAKGVEKLSNVTLASSTVSCRICLSASDTSSMGCVKGAVPRLFIASLPADLKQMRRVDLRKITFIKSILPLILHANELIEQERLRILALRDEAALGRRLAPKDIAWLADTADRYGLNSLDFKYCLSG